MHTRLVFKFRDDLDLLFYWELYQLLVVPSGYDSELELNKKPGLPKNLPDLMQKKLNLLIDLLSHLNSQVGSKPRYLFRYSPIGLFNTIAEKVVEINQQKIERAKITGKLEKPYTMPSFYHCFEYVIPEDRPTNDLEQLIDGFEDFLPIQRTLKPSRPPFPNDPIDDELAGSYLLDFAYLKEEGSETESLKEVIRLGGNQDYFQNMHIPPYSEQGGILSKVRDKWIGVLEKYGWNTAHREFSNARKQNKVVVLTKELPDYDESLRFQNSLINQRESWGAHGTKTLGILLSKVNPNAKVDCRGVVPDAQVALSSTIMELPAGVDDLGKASDSSEENGLAFILNFFLTESKSPGQVILIEFSTSNHQPIIIQPVFSYLITLASSLGHTVVVPAGNNNNVISSIPPLELKQDTNRELKYWKSIFLKTQPLYDPSAPYLLVGAASPSGQSWIVNNSSNWGNLVKIYAQGINILTTSNEGCYDTMAETSAASAIMAGVVVLLQAYALNSTPNRTLSPQEIIQILSGPATLAGTPVSKEGVVVGHIPNVGDALQRIGRLPSHNP